MSECYHCHGDGMDPESGYLLECQICGGNGELHNYGDDEDDEGDWDE